MARKSGGGGLWPDCLNGLVAAPALPFMVVAVDVTTSKKTHRKYQKESHLAYYPRGYSFPVDWENEAFFAFIQNPVKNCHTAQLDIPVRVTTDLSATLF